MNFIEKTIAERLFNDLVAAGHSISVDYGEGPNSPCAVEQSKDWNAIRDASSAVDEVWWFLDAPDDRGKYGQWVFLIWGNDRDCISDYTMSLAPIIDPIINWIEKENM